MLRTKRNTTKHSSRELTHRENYTSEEERRGKSQRMHLNKHYMEQVAVKSLLGMPAGREFSSLLMWALGDCRCWLWGMSPYHPDGRAGYRSRLLSIRK